MRSCGLNNCRDMIKGRVLGSDFYSQFLRTFYNFAHIRFAVTSVSNSDNFIIAVLSKR